MVRRSPAGPDRPLVPIRAAEVPGARRGQAL